MKLTIDTDKILSYFKTKTKKKINLQELENEINSIKKYHQIIYTKLDVLTTQVNNHNNIINKTNKRRNRKWTKNENLTLLHLIKVGKNNNYITLGNTYAKDFGRTPYSIIQRAYLLVPKRKQ